MPEISLIVPGGADAAPYIEAVAACGGRAVAVAPGEPIPDATTGLLLAGEDDAISGAGVSSAILRAVDAGVPVLGIGWGMHAINAAYGGEAPFALQRYGPGPDGGSVRHRIFLAPGAKLSYTIGGSGWVTVNSGNRLGITEAQLAPGILASAIAEDRVVEAVELPGRNWVIGVQWLAHLADELPSGFDNVLMAFVERSGF